MFSKEYLHILNRRPVTTFPIEHGICDELYLYVHLEVLRGLGGVCEWPHHRSARAPTHDVHTPIPSPYLSMREIFDKQRTRTRPFPAPSIPL